MANPCRPLTRLISTIYLILQKLCPMHKLWLVIPLLSLPYSAVH